jgi:anthranilate/para-aminobenzoate synthase component I
MLILPPKEKFLESARFGSIYPIYTELEFIDPKEIYEKIQGPNSFLLESSKGPENISRYSFIGANPFLLFRSKHGNSAITGMGRSSISSSHPLKNLREIMNAFKTEQNAELPPFTGGAVGMISYDFVHYLERLPKTAIDDLAIPDADFMLVDTVVAVDHKLKKTFVISCPGAMDRVSGDLEGHYDEAVEKINNLYEIITSKLFTKEELGGSSDTSGKASLVLKHEMGKTEYMNIVRKAKEYIKAGDIFQTNLSQRVSSEIGDTDPWQIYTILSEINPSPFAAFMDMGDYQIASSSPERLVKVSGNEVETRPIAGTRPRGDDAEGDRQMRNDLLLNEKERAEHLMLIDLERNDLGRISDYSTVKVDELMITEEYSHVIHIVSNIKGTLAKGKDSFDVIKATFPGGTITGVPKVRCMEIIDELEPVTRGPYTGSLGYIDFNGDMDLNIIIRTFVIKDGKAYVQAGAGIVADSDPEREYYETLKKAEALIKTLEVL